MPLSIFSLLEHLNGASFSEEIGSSFTTVNIVCPRPFSIKNDAEKSNFINDFNVLQVNNRASS